MLKRQLKLNMNRDSNFWSIVVFPFDSKNEIFAKFSRIPKVEKVLSENDGNSITIIHSKGAHILNKHDVLDCNFSSDLGSPYHKKLNSHFQDNSQVLRLLLSFAIFSGFISMLFSFFPLFYFNTYLSISYYNSNLTVGGWGLLLALSIILIVAYCLTILFDWVLNMLLKYFRIKSNIGYYERDVINIKLNNNFIQIRIGNWKEKLGFLNNYDREFREPTSSFYHLVQKPNTFSIILFGLITTIFLFNYKTPFWFYQLVEIETVGSNVMNKVFGDNSESLKYWEYYASSNSWDSSNQPIINYNANPIRAFYDGVVSGLIFPIFLLIGIIVLVLLVLSFVIAVLYLLLILLGYGFGGLLAFVLFLIVMDRINNNSNSKNRKLIKILKRFLGFWPLEGYLLLIIILIPFAIIGYKVYALGELMIGENYKYFSWSGSFLLILSTFLIVKKGLRKYKKVLEIVSNDGLLLKFQKFRYIKNKKIVMMAVKNNGKALEFASSELKNDKEIVEAAIKQDYVSFQFASDELKNDSHLKAIYFAEKRSQENKTDLGWEIDWNGIILE
jgi:ABC-type multidrug transport system fused ATPase/permease subunit